MRYEHAPIMKEYQLLKIVGNDRMKKCRSWSCTTCEIGPCIQSRQNPAKTFTTFKHSPILKPTCKYPLLQPSTIYTKPKNPSNGMPSFFTFQQGHDPRGATTDSSPLLGRFRAVPDAPRRNGNHRNSLSLLGSFTSGRRYGGVFGNRAAGDDSSAEDGDGDAVGVIRGWVRTSRDLWLDPKQAAVGMVVHKWWRRWVVLVVLPAALVSLRGRDI